MKSAALRTPDQAKEWLDEHGVSISEFARRTGLPRSAVADALRGKTKGRRGQAHLAAVKLGIKPRPKGEAPFSLDDSGSALKGVSAELECGTSRSGSALATA